ncbi:hypothetical protein ACQ4PT_032065 [Festuca glaucescens]
MDHMHHGHEMMRRPSSGHEAALRSVQKPPSKPWRAGGGFAAPAPTPPKVYRVEPREFRDLVQRLTGAPAPEARQQQQRAALAPAQPVPVRAGGEEVAGQMYTAAPWHSFFPLMAPAAVHPGLDGHQLI